jgi:DNA sulfur modification protein DndB
MSKVMHAPLQLPALRGAIGDWVYFVTLLPFGEVATRISRTEEVHSSRLLREMIQRALTERSKTIAQYLQDQKQRFFNAIVVGVYGGDPEWHVLSIKKSDLFDPAQLNPRVADSLGILTLRGDEKLFTIDGQHRVEGIKEFIARLSQKQLTSLEDEVSAIFVSHRSDAPGLQRTRRLFATLNRYAKPVSLTELIALDEDDVVAITCRELIERHPLFSTGRVSLTRGKAISPRDRNAITSLPALYQTMDIYLMFEKKERWQRFKAVRPTDADLADFVNRSCDFWSALVAAIPELQKVQKLKVDDPIPQKLRSEKGGDFLFRAIAFPLVARCLRKAQLHGIDQPTFLSRFSKVPRILQKQPWLGVLWDGANMTIGEKNVSMAEQLILWMINIDPHEKVYSHSKLKPKLAEITNRRLDEVVLPDKLF